MTKTIRIVPILLFLAFTTACTQPKIVIKDDVTIGSVATSSISINDERPKSDKEYSMGSVLVMSDVYGIWTLGDDMFEPPVPAIFRHSIAKEINTWKIKPTAIHIRLKRLKLEANHQASMLASSSTQLGPLGVAIAETMHGKKFEMDLDKTRPFVLGFIDADVDIRFDNSESVTKSLSVYKAENFSHHMNVEGRQVAAAKVINDLFSTFSSSMQRAN